MNIDKNRILENSKYRRCYGIKKKKTQDFIFQSEYWLIDYSFSYSSPKFIFYPYRFNMEFEPCIEYYFSVGASVSKSYFVPLESLLEQIYLAVGSWKDHLCYILFFDLLFNKCTNKLVYFCCFVNSLTSHHKVS